MFSRRHPFLFFTLAFSAISALALIFFLVVLMAGSGFVSSHLFKAQTTVKEGNVGIVEITGVLTSSKDIIKHITAFREDSAIKAIVLRINSPGGGVGPAQEIYQEVVKTRKKKKIMASLGAVAASGGYYVASASDGIMSNPGTITGSIGVIMEYANFEEILKKIGLSPVVIKSGEFKDIGSPARDITDKERAILQQVADEIHMQFVNDVAAGRHLEVDRVKALADGRIYTGKSALDLKLVDRLGNLGDAVEWAGRTAGIKGEIRPVYPEEDRLTFISRMFDNLFKRTHISGAISDYFRYVIN
ncbi:MAG: signal peptide peptidase SppA [Thermodesulfobacteriota bacterium]|nr:signal peptide peptidase SppA [Thermodesulfobacteriota bacterium]